MHDDECTPTPLPPPPYLCMVTQCEGVVNMVMDAFVHIHEERYYSALNTVDQINQRLDAMDSAKFASQLRRWMPSLTEMINKATKEEVRFASRRSVGC